MPRPPRSACAGIVPARPSTQCGRLRCPGRRAAAGGRAGGGGCRRWLPRIPCVHVATRCYGQQWAVYGTWRRGRCTRRTVWPRVPRRRPSQTQQARTMHWSRPRQGQLGGLRVPSRARRLTAGVRVRRDKPAMWCRVQVPDSEGCASHTGPESGVALGNGRREAWPGECAGRVWSPDIGQSWVPTRSEHAEGHTVDAVMARCRRTRRGRRPLACTETRCAEPGRPCIWPGAVRLGPHGAPKGYDRDGRVQGVGQPHSIDETPEPGCWCARTGGGGGEKGAGQGERGPAYQGPDAVPGSPCHRCSTAYGRQLRVSARHHPRQEPGAVVLHAGICAGGAG